MSILKARDDRPTVQDMYEALLDIEEELCNKANTSWEGCEPRNETRLAAWRCLNVARISVAQAVERLETWERWHKTGLL